jgi:site-specific DNA-methyltransferase (adenine-specific)
MRSRRKRGRKMITTGLFTSNTDEWYTPIDFYNQLDKEFHFNLDPCATDENHKCDKYFTKEVDGLSQKWGGYRVFCNPPYGRTIGKWVKKAYEESKEEKTLVVMLIPARTDTKWFHDYIYGKAEIRFIKGRLKFGGCNNSAPFPSMVVIFGEEGEKQR